MTRRMHGSGAERRGRPRRLGYLDEDQVRGLVTRDDALVGLVTTVVQQILEAQVSDHLQAQPYERTEERRG
ncbi:MAG: hypothetical protein NVSMB65_21870 [Chloroflexota bacterium]